MIITLPNPKPVNHDQLSATLGYPVSLILDPAGNCTAVKVSNPYYHGNPPTMHAIPGGIDEAAILAAVAALG